MAHFNLYRVKESNKPAPFHHYFEDLSRICQDTKNFREYLQTMQTDSVNLQTKKKEETKK